MCTMLKKLLEAKDSGISEENYFFGRNLSVDTYFSDAFSLNNFSVCNHYSKFYSFINLLKRVESNEEHNYDYSNIDKDPHPKKRNRLTISISDSKSSTLIVKEFSEYQ
ncbi:12305_t:CDS:2 [Dentiscutata erythropus]|uniref:12305_t:CDS:1 n=1 Tax=Dentiscutata erythropus TaxID=1348616 RepID=A0A9N8ZXV7_9GLOM|nr:12305_t:CDS:2 [Dentiscutata erythropus]